MESFSCHNRNQADVTIQQALFQRIKETKLFVLIVAYMRSGSSFTGKFFDLNKDGLYLFEPLNPIDYEKGDLSLPDGSKRALLRMVNRRAFGVDVLENIFTSFIFTAVTQTSFSFRGASTKKYIACLMGDRKSCLCVLNKLCDESSLRAVKTIRLRLHDVWLLTEHLPSLKIVHLLRDPRAIIQSRIKMKAARPLQGKILCRQMEVDLMTYELFQKLYPGRVMQVLYEHLATHPIKMAENICSKLGMRLPEYVKTELKKMTSGIGKGLDSEYGKVRRNSSATAVKWRNSISWQTANHIDRVCSAVYKRLGYLPFPTESDLRNLNVPSWT